jgi:hypothetical protein
MKHSAANQQSAFEEDNPNLILFQLYSRITAKLLLRSTRTQKTSNSSIQGLSNHIKINWIKLQFTKIIEFKVGRPIGGKWKFKGETWSVGPSQVDRRDKWTKSSRTDGQMRRKGRRSRTVADSHRIIYLHLVAIHLTRNSSPETFLNGRLKMKILSWPFLSTCGYLLSWWPYFPEGNIHFHISTWLLFCQPTLTADNGLVFTFKCIILHIVR